MTETAGIRLARPEDRWILIEIKRRASLAVEAGEVLRRLEEQPEHFDVDPVLITRGEVFLVESDGIPRGFASFILEDGEGKLDGVFVEPGHWRRGLGRMLLAAVEHELVARRARRIRVVAGHDAVALYLSAGFTVIGEARTPLGPVVPVMAKLIAAP